MTGSLNLAKKIVELDKKYWRDQNSLDEHGFSFVGSGGTRTVYRGPDGVAYKVGDADCNVREAEASKALRRRRLFKDMEVVVPKATAYKVNYKDYVCAMDFVPDSGMQVKCDSFNGALYRPNKCNCRKWGTPRACFGLILDRLIDYGIDDLFYANIIYSTDKKFHLIDLGYQEL